jgi:hypothetical protein
MQPISLQFHSLDGRTQLEVDKNGNPVEIAIVICYQVDDTCRALFNLNQSMNNLNLQQMTAAQRVMYNQFNNNNNLRRFPTEQDMHNFVRI